MKEQKGWITATGNTDSTKILIKISHSVLSLCVTCNYRTRVHLMLRETQLTTLYGILREKKG